METREKALAWWNGLTFEEKFIAMVKAKTVVIGYPDRNPETLTGREVELLMNDTNLRLYNFWLRLNRAPLGVYLRFQRMYARKNKGKWIRGIIIEDGVICFNVE